MIFIPNAAADLPHSGQCSGQNWGCLPHTAQSRQPDAQQDADLAASAGHLSCWREPDVGLSQQKACCMSDHGSMLCPPHPFSHPSSSHLLSFFLFYFLISEPSVRMSVLPCHLLFLLSKFNRLLLPSVWISCLESSESSLTVTPLFHFHVDLCWFSFLLLMCISFTLAAINSLPKIFYILSLLCILVYKKVMNLSGFNFVS